MQLPMLEDATEVTEFVWPFSTCFSSPVKASHTRTDLLSHPETMQLPSLENATALIQLSMLRVNGVPPIKALENWGIPGKWLFQS